ncbi:hypothetical protein DAEQUDRAFT_89497 [Daedalea quercina L-15889]|uniref:Uncharacterized protein n=1 Tax=Daedalea quercina L-15889 TaxID=1314783 RepID=A0A165KXW7_9APHY|nr:hypothetical protein DAEQUDRAFT_89497 [Daedalea quercina L-15889]
MKPAQIPCPVACVTEHNRSAQQAKSLWSHFVIAPLRWASRTFRTGEASDRFPLVCTISMTPSAASHLPPPSYVIRLCDAAPLAGNSIDTRSHTLPPAVSGTSILRPVTLTLGCLGTTVDLVLTQTDASTSF